MTFPVSLILPMVRAAIRMARAGDAALSQQLRDTAAYVPSLSVAGLVFASNIQEIVAIFISEVGLKARENDPALDAAYRQFHADQTNKNLQEELIRRAAEFTTTSAVVSGAALADELKIAEKIGNWQKNRGPLSAWKQFALTFADIALEFVASAPNVLGLGSNGEKLMAALARALSEAIPDDGEFGPRAHFGERVLATVLRSGLQVAAARPELIFGEDHLQALMRNTVTPLIKAFPAENATLAERADWHVVVDTLLGPVASAGIQTVAENQKAFLGGKFSSDAALGAVTQVVLKTVASGRLADLGSQETVVTLYQAVLGLAAAQPALFLGKADNIREKAIENLFVDLASQLGKEDGLWTPELGLALATTALSALQADIGKFVRLRGDGDWNVVMQEVLRAVIGGVRDSVTGQKKISDVLTSAQLIEFGRIFFAQVAKSPRMIVGGDSTILNSVVAALAKTIAEDEDLLLGGDDWLELVAVALDQGAGKLRHDVDWGAVVRGVVESVVGGLRAGRQGSKKVADILAPAQMKEFVRIFLVQASKTPQMIVGNGAAELQGIVAALAGSIAADKDLLLSGDQWIEIAAVALEEAAANPGRLFNLTPIGPQDHLAVEVISGLLRAAAEDARHTRQQGGVLYGQTLRTAMVTALSAMAGGVVTTAMASLGQKIEDLARKINARIRVKDSSGRFELGAKEWLAIFRKLLPNLLSGGSVPEFVDAAGTPTSAGKQLLDQILSGLATG